MILDPKSVRKTPSFRDAALYVAGQKMAEGTESEMKGLFDAEIAGHRALVELRVRTPAGQYVTKLKRS